MYQLTEQEIYLKSFVDVISSEFYGDIYREILNEIGILKGFVINRDNRHDWHTASNAKKYTNSEYLEYEERLKKETWNKCASHFRTWYLEKKLSRMYESLLDLRDERKRMIGSIIYNGHLKRLEELLGICTQCNCLIDDNTNEIRKLKSETIRDLDMASLSAISYHLPSDLFDEFNPYIFDILCDGVYLRTSDMNLTRTGRYKSYTQAKLDELGVSENKKIEKEDLKEYLNSLIEVKSFWKEKLIDDFLKICVEQLTSPGPEHLRLGIKSLFKKETLEQIENVREEVAKMKRTLFLSNESLHEKLEIIENSLHHNGELRFFNQWFCCFYHPEIFSNLDDFYKATSLWKNYYICCHDGASSPKEINSARKEFESFLKSNFNKIKNDILKYLDEVEELRIELAMKLFNLTVEEVKQISAEDLELKYQELLDKEVEKLKQARIRLANNKQENMIKLISNSILEKSNIADGLNSNIEKLRGKVKEAEKEIREIASDILDTQEITSFNIEGDNSELSIYILNRLIMKYRPLIEPKIIENAKDREQQLLQSKSNNSSFVPFNLVDLNNGIPVIGPAITRKLEG